MSMQAESLEVLEKASVPSAQARAIVRAIEIELASARDTLATKSDIAELRAEMRQLVGQLRGETANMAGQLRSEMASTAGQLRSEMASTAGHLRSEIAKMGGELHAEIHRVVGSSTRQMYAALLGHMAVTLGFIYFLFTQVR